MNKPRWSEKDIIFLKANYKHMSNKELSTILKTNIKRIVAKLNRLNLTRDRPVYNETDICKDYLSKNYSISRLANKWNISVKIVRSIFKKNNIQKVINTGNKRKFYL
jgi:DNA-binding CsgD family transcriptional regulator